LGEEGSDCEYVFFGTAAKVQEKVDAFFSNLAKRSSEVMQRCRRQLQAQADLFVTSTPQVSYGMNNVDFMLRSV
jgi:hypothetical protein